MKTIKSVVCVLGIFLVLFFTADADARIGGGGSMGSRGSRGFSRSYSQPSRGGGSSFSRSTPPVSAPNPNYPPSQSGGFMRGVLGGMAGGFLGSMLFRNSGYAGGAQAGGGGMGLFDLLLLAGLGFFLYRAFIQKRSGTSTSDNYYREQPNQTFNTISRPVNEDEAPQFDVEAFKEQRMDDFLKIQSAWNMRDISSVQNLIVPELRTNLNADIESLKKSHQINKLENIAVRAADLTESWQEAGKEYATLRFRAQLLDYTIDEATQNVVSGDRSNPVKFEEEWTYVRNNNDPLGETNWKLTAISNQ